MIILYIYFMPPTRPTPPAHERPRVRPLRVLGFAALLAVTAGAAPPDPGDLILEPAQVQPPPLQLRGEANPEYARELEARLGALPAWDRPLFFKLLRRQQRSLDRFLEELEFNYRRADALHGALAGQSQDLAARSAGLMAAQRQTILLYRAMARAIDDLRRREDVLKLDSMFLHVDLYAGIQFDTLYEDQQQSASFFSKSLPFVSLDLRSGFRWPGRERWLETFGTLTFESTSKESSDTVAVITRSGDFRGEMGLWSLGPLTENVSWGVLCSTGLVGYSTREPGAGLAAPARDQLRSTFHVGFTLRQESGALRNSMAEVGYERDPLFIHSDRLVVKGKVVLTQFGLAGGNGDFFMEGWTSKGLRGRDEAVLLLGVRLDTMAFFRNLGGGGKL